MVTIIYWFNEILCYISLGLIIFWNFVTESENINHKKYIEYLMISCALTSASSFSLGWYISGTIWLFNFIIWTFFYKNNIE